MNIRSRFIPVVFLIASLAALGCGSSSNPACTAGELRCTGEVLEVCTAGDFVTEQDCAAAGGTCETAAGSASCELPSVWDVTVTVRVGTEETPVNLAALDKTTFDGHEAVRLTRIVEVVALELPWNHQYNFVASDGFDVLNDRYEGDRGPLPCWGEMEGGYLFWTELDGLQIGWEAELGLPRALGVKQMQGGIIEAVEIPTTHLMVHAGEVRFWVELAGLTTVDVVDYKHPEDGAKPMIPLVDIFTAAAVTDPDNLVYKIFGQDGFSNADDNLMPYENASHTYLNPDGRKIVSEEAWDTEVCCWRVADTVRILGQTAP